VGQLLFAPWAWAYSTLHPFMVGKWVYTGLSGCFYLCWMAGNTVPYDRISSDTLYDV